MSENKLFKSSQRMQFIKEEAVHFKSTKYCGITSNKDFKAVSN